MKRLARRLLAKHIWSTSPAQALARSFGI